MKALKKILIAIGALLALNILVFTINIMQKGGPYRGQTPGQILGKPAAEAQLADLVKLSKPEFIQLFYACPPPAPGEMKGEYTALNHPGGILAGAVQVFTDHFFGPGRWTGKAFNPAGKDRGEGYNIFAEKVNGAEKLNRARRIETYVGKSEFDGKDSFHLVYAPYNTFVVHSMRDELRRLKDGLYIGLGYMGLGGGSVNPSLFIVHGPAKDWVGPDK